MTGGPRPLGLRVDVTSRRGAAEGLPRLGRLLGSAGGRASVFVSTGPDEVALCLLSHLGRPLLLPRALRLARQMGLPLLSRAAELILPSPVLGQAGVEAVKEMEASGHEIGPLGFRYWRWLREMPRHAGAFALSDQEEAFDAFASLFGRPPVASASPGFLCAEETLKAKEAHSLRYASDCRGSDPFFPSLSGKSLATPQVPVTLPALSELLDAGCPSPEEAFERLGREAQAQEWPVLRIRAEVEGCALAPQFEGFLGALGASGLAAVPLGALLERRLQMGPLPACTLSYGELEGRPGIVSMQMFEI